MPKFIMLIGMPASGKSTLIKSLSCNATVISTDDIIEEYAKEQGKTYDEVFADYIKEATFRFNAFIQDDTYCGVDIVIDRTNMSVKSRARVMAQISQGFKYEKIAVVVSCDPVEREKRLLSRPGKTIPLHVIKSMEASYEPPTHEEGFTNIYHIQT